jgi:hypothetical protein
MKRYKRVNRIDKEYLSIIRDNGQRSDVRKKYDKLGYL